jgi:hypothetical protein
VSLEALTADELAPRLRKLRAELPAVKMESVAAAA